MDPGEPSHRKTPAPKVASIALQAAGRLSDWWHWRSRFVGFMQQTGPGLAQALLDPAGRPQSEKCTDRFSCRASEQPGFTPAQRQSNAEAGLAFSCLCCLRPGCVRHLRFVLQICFVPAFTGVSFPRRRESRFVLRISWAGGCGKRVATGAAPTKGTRFGSYGRSRPRHDQRLSASVRTGPRRPPHGWTTHGHRPYPTGLSPAEKFFYFLVEPGGAIGLY